MIEQFHVTAFKSLEDVTVELGRVNVLIGPNGSGKSNFLEALGVLGAAARGRVDHESLLRRGVRPGTPDRFRTAFPDKRHKAQIRLEAASHEASYAVGLWQNTDPEEPAWRYHTESLMEGGTQLVGRSPASRRKYDPVSGLAALKIVELEKSNPAYKLMRRLANYRIFSPTTPHLRGLVADDSGARPVGLSGGSLAEALGELLKDKNALKVKKDVLKLIEWAVDVDIVSARELMPGLALSSQRTMVRFTDKYMTNWFNQLSALDASEGALYILFAAVLALHPASPRILAIDNLDHALNPRVARALMQHFCKWVLARQRIQILLTCQNPTMLDGLPLIDKRVRLFAVDRTTRGRTSITPIKVEGEILQKAREGWTLSRMWVSGVLGGVPNV